MWVEGAFMAINVSLYGV